MGRDWAVITMLKRVISFHARGGGLGRSTVSRWARSQLGATARRRIPRASASQTAGGEGYRGKGPKRLLLVDGNALVYRAYWGYHYLNLSNAEAVRRANAEGEAEGEEQIVDTSSLFGFLRMLLVLLEIRPLPDYVSIVFDSKEKTFRHEIYSEYKQNRKPTPEDLKHVVFPQVRGMCRALNLHTIALPGYEADDVIGSICRSALDSKSTAECTIDLVTPDKDFFQLLGPRVRMLRPQKKKDYDSQGPGSGSGIAYEVYTERTFREDFTGLSPSTFVDVQALSGDTADNVPGVRGIGPKTAVKLLQEFDTLEDVFRNASTIKGKVARAALTTAEGVAMAKLSRRLVELDCTIPEEVLFRESLESDLVFARPLDQGEEVMALLNKYDFKTLIPRVQNLWNSLRDADGNSAQEEDTEAMTL